MYVCVYIYIYGQGLLSAYLLGKNLLKIGERVHFSTKKKSTTNFARLFLFFSLSPFASKWLKCAVFAFQKGREVGRKRGLRHIYIYIYAVELKTGPIFAFSSVKNWSIFFLFCFFVFKNLILPAERRGFFQKAKKKKKTQKMTHF